MIIWTLGKSQNLPDLVNRVDELTLQCFYKPGYHLAAACTKFLTIPCKVTQEEDFQDCLSKWQNDGVSVFRDKGHALRGADSNVSFIAIQF